MLSSTNADTENEKKNENITGTRGKTTRTRAATHTNYKALWVLAGLVAVLTVGFCYLITTFLRLIENHHRDGDRLKDMMRARLYEQQDKNH